MPVVFIGHGSPMNAIEKNSFTDGWRNIAERIPKPKAILMISAHWYEDGLMVTTGENPNLIYDLYGFPREIYLMDYNPRGSVELANRVGELLGNVTGEPNRGLDHGAWVVLNVMYPEADIPVIQLSIDNKIDISTHFYMAEKLKSLRDEGVLIIGSGNVVHNLERLSYDSPKGYDWAYEFDRYIKERIEAKRFEDILDYRSIGKYARLSVPSPDHFCPLLYVLGVCDKNDSVEVYNNECIYGSLSMTSYVLGL
jgi:Uncharacterized conserved protein